MRQKVFAGDVKMKAAILLIFFQQGKKQATIKSLPDLPNDS